MCHVCRLICYLCVELKLMINTRSISNQALNSAHPSLPSSRCWPWGLFIGAGQPLQHGEVRDTNLAWVRPVIQTTSVFQWLDWMIGCWFRNLRNCHRGDIYSKDTAGANIRGICNGSMQVVRMWQVPWWPLLGLQPWYPFSYIKLFTTTTLQ